MTPTIRVTGVGRAAVKPDLTVISLFVSAKNRDEAQAMAGAAKQIGALRQALEPLGFGGDALKTVSFSVNAEYDGVREGGAFKNVFSGFCVRHGLKLEFPLDTGLLSRTLAAVTSTVAEPELNVGFTVGDREAPVCGLLRDAAVTARSRAEALAEASGMRLGRLVRIEYGDRGLDIVSPTRFNANVRMKAAADCAVEPEDIKLEETVSFEWELE